MYRLSVNALRDVARLAEGRKKVIITGEHGFVRVYVPRTTRSEGSLSVTLPDSTHNNDAEPIEVLVRTLDELPKSLTGRVELARNAKGAWYIQGELESGWATFVRSASVTPYEGDPGMWTLRMEDSVSGFCDAKTLVLALRTVIDAVSDEDVAMTHTRAGLAYIHLASTMVGDITTLRVIGSDGFVFSQVEIPWQLSSTAALPVFLMTPDTAQMIIDLKPTGSCTLTLDSEGRVAVDFPDETRNAVVQYWQPTAKPLNKNFAGIVIKWAEQAANNSVAVRVLSDALFASLNALGRLVLPRYQPVDDLYDAPDTNQGIVFRVAEDGDLLMSGGEAWTPADGETATVRLTAYGVERIGGKINPVTIDRLLLDRVGFERTFTAWDTLTLTLIGPKDAALLTASGGYINGDYEPGLRYTAAVMPMSTGTIGRDNPFIKHVTQLESQLDSSLPAQI